MAITVSSGNTYNSGTSNVASGVVSLPGSVAAGDITLLVATVNCTAASISAPAGWNTAVASFQPSGTTTAAAAVFWRAWQSGDGDVTVTPSGSGRLVLSTYRVQGAEVAVPIVATATAPTGTGQTVIVAPSVTATSTNQALVTVHAARTGTSGATITGQAPDAAETELGDLCSSNASNFNVAHEVAWQALSASGATGTRTSTPTFSSGTCLTMPASIILAPTADAAGSLSLSGSGVAGTSAAGSLSLAGSAAASVAGSSAAGSLSLAGAGVAGTSAAGSLSLAGSAVWGASAAGALSLSATGAGITGGLDFGAVIAAQGWCAAVSPTRWAAEI